MKEEFLTKKQKAILELAKSNGFVTPEVVAASCIYDGPQNRKNALMKLKRLGFLKIGESGKLFYVGGDPDKTLDEYTEVDRHVLEKKEKAK